MTMILRLSLLLTLFALNQQGANGLKLSENLVAELLKGVMSLNNRHTYANPPPDLNDDQLAPELRDDHPLPEPGHEHPVIEPRDDHRLPDPRDDHPLPEPGQDHPVIEPRDGSLLRVRRAEHMKKTFSKAMEIISPRTVESVLNMVLGPIGVGSAVSVVIAAMIGLLVSTFT